MTEMFIFIRERSPGRPIAHNQDHGDVKQALEIVHARIMELLFQLCDFHIHKDTEFCNIVCSCSVKLNKNQTARDPCACLRFGNQRKYPQ